ncbi:MAG: ribosome maturation factor RimM [Angelakisella sp.]
MKQRFLECGKIVAIHGLKGDLKVQCWGGSPEELCDFGTLFFDKGEKPVTVEKARMQKNMVLLKLEGVDTPEQAQALRGKVLYIDRELDNLEDGQYYIQDLIGLRVVDADDGHLYGTLCDVSETGANDVYHIRFEDGTVKLIPAIPQVVLKIDIDAGEMTIRPLVGLFEDEEDDREV